MPTSTQKHSYALDHGDGGDRFACISAEACPVRTLFRHSLAYDRTIASTAFLMIRCVKSRAYSQLGAAKHCARRRQRHIEIDMYIITEEYDLSMSTRYPHSWTKLIIRAEVP